MDVSVAKPQIPFHNTMARLSHANGTDSHDFSLMRTTCSTDLCATLQCVNLLDNVLSTKSLLSRCLDAGKREFPCCGSRISAQLEESTLTPCDDKKSVQALSQLLYQYSSHTLHPLISFIDSHHHVLISASIVSVLPIFSVQAFTTSYLHNSEPCMNNNHVSRSTCHKCRRN